MKYDPAFEALKQAAHERIDDLLWGIAGLLALGIILLGIVSMTVRGCWP